MGSVQSISTEVDLGRFFDAMYGTAEGYAYSATKDPVSEVFKQYFFKWPLEREQLITHCLNYTGKEEVYYGPALYKKAGAEKEDFLGTYYVWCEFDGNAPESIPDVPPPSIRVQSSVSANQHWYWRLNHFVTDRAVLEAITKKITYHAKADFSAWNCNRILRPPGTKHHESGNTVTVMSWDINPYPVEEFDVLPELPIVLASEEDVKDVPAPLMVLMKYPFTEEERNFFTEKEISKGHRSSALTKFAHICMEKKMSNAETMSLLLNLDERWGKFKNRRDRTRLLLSIVNYCRSQPQHAVDPVKEELDQVKTNTLRVFTWDEFIRHEVKLEWVIEGLIHKKGSVMVAGPPGVGKSQISLRFAERIAKGESFLKWSIEKPLKILVVSMEMPFEELNSIMKTMKIEENDLLRQNLLISAPGHSVRLNSKINQAMLNKTIEEFQPDGIMFDSFGKSVNDDISSDKIILETFDYIDGTLRNEYGLFTWFVHHNRKAQIGNKKPNKLEDLYGNQYIGANITTGLGLYKAGNHIEMSCLKLRMAEEFSPFKIRRTPDLDFKEVTGTFESKDEQVFEQGFFGNLGEDLGDLGSSL